VNGTGSAPNCGTKSSASTNSGTQGNNHAAADVEHNQADPVVSDGIGRYSAEHVVKEWLEQTGKALVELKLKGENSGKESTASDILRIRQQSEIILSLLTESNGEGLHSQPRLVQPFDPLTLQEFPTSQLRDESALQASNDATEAGSTIGGAIDVEALMLKLSHIKESLTRLPSGEIHESGRWALGSVVYGCSDPLRRKKYTGQMMGEARHGLGVMGK
jgi:hypothetical protein